MMQISVIIPTYNEAGGIAKLIAYLKKIGGTAMLEVIVIDGGSLDDTVAIAAGAGAQALKSPRKGRAAQMNYGASIAKGDVLYFVHADTFPPATFANDLVTAVDKGADLGRYKTRFDSPKHMLKINAWFTRFDLFICMGGDQTLFIRKSLFDALGGFKEDMQIMEEYEFCVRARRQGRYVILDGEALISARKYDKNSWLTVQLANSMVVRMYKRGASQAEMVNTYKKRLRF